ncbi:MAG: helix-turn-helix domain-containing protein [Negativicutes bacterium]|nr:helix-turn-helix domain-containing protein [Negativicutes bacterium]
MDVLTMQAVNAAYENFRDMEEDLETYFRCTGVNVLAIDEKGIERSFHGQTISYCREYIKRTGENCDCGKVHFKACKQSVGLNEPYFMMCPLNLVNIVVPLMKNGIFSGGLIAGPVVMSTPYNQIHLYNMGDASQAENYRILEEFLKVIPCVDPIRTGYLGNLLYILSSSRNSDLLYKAKEKAKLDSQIYEQIQTFKDNNLETINIRTREKGLFTKVQQGKYEEAKIILGELLALIYLLEGKNLDATKARCNELNALVSRAALDGGAPIKEILAFNMLLTKELRELKNIDEISSWMSHALNYYCESITPMFEAETMTEIKKAIQYINSHYKEDITLNHVASYVHLNPSYFSALFKRIVGANFIDYILGLRIEESKDLLINTSKTINEIAVAVGFTNQTYFGRMFKRRTGRTPGFYRQKHGT